MNRTEARDIINTHVTASVPSGTYIAWPDVPSSIPSGEPWVRPTIHHATGRQATLAGENGIRRWKRAGLMTIQCFTPVGDGYATSDTLVETMVSYFEGLRNSQMWYRNIRSMEVGKDGASVQVNVMAEFEYDAFN